MRRIPLLLLPLALLLAACGSAEETDPCAGLDCTAPNSACAIVTDEAGGTTAFCVADPATPCADDYTPTCDGTTLLVCGCDGGPAQTLNSCDDARQYLYADGCEAPNPECVTSNGRGWCVADSAACSYGDPATCDGDLLTKCYCLVDYPVADCPDCCDADRYFRSDQCDSTGTCDANAGECL